MINSLRNLIKDTGFLAIVGIVVAIIFGLVHYLRLRQTEEQARRAKEQAAAAKEEARMAKEKVDSATKNIENIEKHFGIPIYVDGLREADPLVFDPFAKGLKLMMERKSEAAIVEFRKSMKEAKASELVALFNIVGNCYYTMGELGRATENYCQSLILAREFNDKRGELATIGNLGLIYQKKEDLEKALEYHKEALRLARIQDRKERYFHIFVYLCFIVIFLFMFFIFSNQLRLGAKMEQNTLAKTYPDEKPTLDTLTNRLLNK